MRRILLATEGSACSIQAIRQFIDLNEGRPAEVHVLSVIPEGNCRLALPHEVETYNREADMALEALDLALVDLARAGLQATSAVRVGDPAAAIVQVAQELQVELIVMGTRGGKGGKCGGDGSVAHEVLRRAPCAVLIQPCPSPLPSPLTGV